MLQFIEFVLTQLYVRVGILLACEKHLHDRIISLRGEAHKTGICPTFFIEAHVQIQKTERVLILSLSTIWLLDIVAVPTVWYIFFVSFYDLTIRYCSCSDSVIYFVCLFLRFDYWIL
jgi:hypothetical protein